jgi:hypothetical protein
MQEPHRLPLTVTYRKGGCRSRGDCWQVFFGKRAKGSSQRVERVGKGVGTSVREMKCSRKDVGIMAAAPQERCILFWNSPAALP